MYLSMTAAPYSPATLLKGLTASRIGPVAVYTWQCVALAPAGLGDGDLALLSGVLASWSVGCRSPPP